MCVSAEPLPVRDLQGRYVETGEGGGVFLWWRPAEGSTQDEYKANTAKLAEPLFLLIFTFSKKLGIKIYFS